VSEHERIKHARIQAILDNEGTRTFFDEWRMKGRNGVIESLDELNNVCKTMAKEIPALGLTTSKELFRSVLSHLDTKLGTTKTQKRLF
jgi:hypothetical protein